MNCGAPFIILKPKVFYISIIYILVYNEFYLDLSFLKCWFSLFTASFNSSMSYACMCYQHPKEPSSSGPLLLHSMLSFHGFHLAIFLNQHWFVLLSCLLFIFLIEACLQFIVSIQIVFERCCLTFVSSYYSWKPCLNFSPCQLIATSHFSV